MQKLKKIFFSNLLQIGLFLSLFSASGVFFTPSHFHFNPASLVDSTFSVDHSGAHSLDQVCPICQLAQSLRAFSFSSSVVFNSTIEVGLAHLFKLKIQNRSKAFTAYQATAPPVSFISLT